VSGVSSIEIGSEPKYIPSPETKDSRRRVWLSIFPKEALRIEFHRVTVDARVMAHLPATIVYRFSSSSCLNGTKHVTYVSDDRGALRNEVIDI